ncbi:MAG: hypothetical protein E6H05_11785, partial [Bacillati bacterium ANGP1]
DWLVYVTDTHNDRVQVFDTTGLYLYGWGRPGASPGAFDLPLGIAVGSSRVFVVDSGNYRVQIFDLKGNYLAACGSYGTQLGQFNRPVGIAVDPAENFYIADSGNNRIQKFNASCQPIAAWGKYGSLAGQLAEPTGIAYHGGQIIVTDLVNHRIQVFDTQGKFVYQWGRHPAREHEGNGRMHYPSAVSINPSGSFAVVCEPFENRCQIFLKEDLKHVQAVNDSAWWLKGPRFHYGTGAKELGPAPGPGGSGKPMELVGMTEPDTHFVVLFDITSGPTPRKVAKFGGFGAQPGRFNQPEGLAADSSWNVYVSDRGNNRIQVFDIHGRYIRTIGGFGTGLGQFRSPGKLDFDAQGHLYVLDVGNNRIQVLEPMSGKALRAWGTKGSGSGQFLQAESMCVDTLHDRVYVVDTGNFRIQVFNTMGRHLRSWGSPGIGPDKFLWPYGIACGTDGYTYVTDASQQRVKKFTADGAFVREWGQFGALPGQFYKPKGIAQDSRGYLYVVDFGNHRGQVFTADGGFVRIFGEGELRPEGPGSIDYRKLFSAVPLAVLGLLVGVVLWMRR